LAEWFTDILREFNINQGTPDLKNFIQKHIEDDTYTNASRGMLKAVVEHDDALTRHLLEHHKKVAQKVKDYVLTHDMNKSSAEIMAQLLELCRILLSRDTSATIFIKSQIRDFPDV
jgi:hypothetical protein